MDSRERALVKVVVSERENAVLTTRGKCRARGGDGAVRAYLVKR